MSSLERGAHGPAAAGQHQFWSALSIALCLSGLVLGWPRSSDAQSPPPSEREAERRRLLDQLGLKKRAPATPAPKGEPKGDADEERGGVAEKGKDAPNEPPAVEEGKPGAKPEPPPGLGFSGSVQRALGACRGCHVAGGSAGGGAYVLDGTLEADFAATRRFVNVGAPAESPLLRLATGAGHKGGTVLAPASAEYQLLLRWIAAGAKRGGALAPVASAPVIERQTSAAVRADARPTLTPSAAPPVVAAPVAALPAAAAPPASPPPGLVYAPELHDALNQACSGCHRPGALAGATGYVLTGEVGADFASARRFVDLARPETSPLLAKASGVTHAGGSIYPAGSDGHRRLLAWIASGALGPIAAALDIAQASGTPGAAQAPGALHVAEAPPGPAPRVAVAAAPAATLEPHGAGLRLPFDLRLNGRFDLNYERRNFDTQPFSSGDNAIQSYHHFVFLSRQSQGDPVGFTAELVNLTFWEVQYRLSLPASAGQGSIKAGKLLVPFGPDPLFHQSYGGLAGFDQRVLPAIWAQEGLSGRWSLEKGDLSGSADVYAVRGHELRERDATLNLQSDLSALDSVQVAVGARLRVSWDAVSLFYSGYGNGLGFGRVLYLQAVDVALWRLRGVPVLEHLAADAGLLRADVSGAGPGQDYYHFASYFRLRYFFTDLAYVQYRQGLRTFDNRRGVILDDTRLTREDGSTHNFGLVSRHGPLTFGLYYFFNLEKADEVDDDFLRVTGVYEF